MKWLGSGASGSMNLWRWLHELAPVAPAALGSVAGLEKLLGSPQFVSPGGAKPETRGQKIAGKGFSV